MNQQPLTRREARELERLREIPGYVSKIDPETVDDFHPVSGPVGLLEPKSLVIEDPIQDLGNLNVVLPESGAVLTTGAIDLPWLKLADPDTESIVVSASEADASTAAELSEGAISGIDPIPARTYARTRRKASVFPTRLRKGWGVVHLVALSAFVLFALLCALIASMMLGVIKL